MNNLLIFGMRKSITVIGSGFAGLSSASYLAKSGFDVTLLEKNDQLGGRARVWSQYGFTFDMGPSWYWMPDVFDRYFKDFGHTSSDFYDLKRLDPSYRIFFGENDVLDVPADMSELMSLFESLETGSSDRLKQFLGNAQRKYEVGMQDLVYKPGLSIKEFFDSRVFKGLFQLSLLKSHSSHIKSYFSHPKIKKILEFPVLFLGATPEKTPALYSMMNYADISLGTWYPMGGMNKIIQAMTAIAQEQGVKIKTGVTVLKMSSHGGMVEGITTSSGITKSDVVVSAADYHHIETKVLEPKDRSYSEKYWDSRTLAPSCLIFYLGVSKKISGLKHHNLFFDNELGPHAKQIYDDPSWPDDPLFYVCCPSKTDTHVAPEGQENLFILMPIAPDLQDNLEIRSRYFDLLIKRLEFHTGDNIKGHISVKRSYAINDFKSDYNSYKGNAYGLANTLKQTAILKPKVRSKKLNNLYYSGQLTVPGPGVPPSIISGRLVADLILKNHGL